MKSFDVSLARQYRATVGKFVLLVILLFSAVEARAVADLQANIEIENQGVFPVSTPVRASLRFFNAGPDPVPLVSAGYGFYITPGHRTVGVFPAIDTPPCGINYLDFVPPPPQPAYFSASLFAPEPLEAGETVICTVLLIAYPEIAGHLFSLDFTVAGSYPGGGFQDPDPSNNNIVVDLHIAGGNPAPVPVPATIPSGDGCSQGLLFAAIALAAALSLRNRL